jgi:hypothetical protein
VEEAVEAKEAEVAETEPTENSTTQQNEEQPQSPPAPPDVSIVYTDEDRKDESADITIDSIRDHITSTVVDGETVIEKREEQIQVERKEHTTTIVKTGTITAASEADAVAALLAQE